jgi:hypothetical protein
MVKGEVMARVKYLSAKVYNCSGKYPNFHKTGSIKGMKAKFYGKHALLVRQGSWIYNVTVRIYNMAH